MAGAADPARQDEFAALAEPHRRELRAHAPSSGVTWPRWNARADTGTGHWYRVVRQKL